MYILLTPQSKPPNLNARFLDEEPRDGELLEEPRDGPGPSEPRASWVDVDAPRAPNLGSVFLGLFRALRWQVVRVFGFFGVYSLGTLSHEEVCPCPS